MCAPHSILAPPDLAIPCESNPQFVARSGQPPRKQEQVAGPFARTGRIQQTWRRLVDERIFIASRYLVTVRRAISILATFSISAIR